MLDDRSEKGLGTEGGALHPPAASTSLGERGEVDAPALRNPRSRGKALLRTAGGKLAAGLGLAAVVAVEWKCLDFLTDGFSRGVVVFVTLLLIGHKLLNEFSDELEPVLSRNVPVPHPGRWMTRTQRVVVAVIAIFGFGLGIGGAQTTADTHGALWVGALLLTVVSAVVLLVAVLSEVDGTEPEAPPHRNIVATLAEPPVPLRTHPAGSPLDGEAPSAPGAA